MLRLTGVVHLRFKIWCSQVPSILGIQEVGSPGRTVQVWLKDTQRDEQWVSSSLYSACQAFDAGLHPSRGWTIRESRQVRCLNL